MLSKVSFSGLTLDHLIFHLFIDFTFFTLPEIVYIRNKEIKQEQELGKHLL